MQRSPQRALQKGKQIGDEQRWVTKGPGRQLVVCGPRIGRQSCHFSDLVGGSGMRRSHGTVSRQDMFYCREADK